MQSPLQKKKFFFLLIYFWLHWVSIAARVFVLFCFVLFFFLVTASRAYCLAAVHGLLIMVAFLVVEHRL